MNKYLIYNANASDMGIFEGKTKNEAIYNLLVDAGYKHEITFVDDEIYYSDDYLSTFGECNLVAEEV